MLTFRRLDRPPVLFRAETHSADERTAYMSGNGLQISIYPQKDYPFTRFVIADASRCEFDESLMYSHLALAKLLTEYQFRTVLEIGSRNGTAARAFKFAWKEVTTCEILDTFKANVSGDYLDLAVTKPFDTIWCSHVLEHQRYLGRFLEKMFSDLKDGGVLAVTVPTALSPLMIGHCNIFTPAHLLYHLILAGFDCSEARVKVYDWQFSILVRKKPNGIPPISFATTHFDEGSKLGFDKDLLSFFPPVLRDHFSSGGHVWGEFEQTNW